MPIGAPGNPGSTGAYGNDIICESSGSTGAYGNEASYIADGGNALGNDDPFIDAGETGSIYVV